MFRYPSMPIRLLLMVGVAVLAACWGQVWLLDLATPPRESAGWRRSVFAAENPSVLKSLTAADLAQVDTEAPLPRTEGLEPVFAAGRYEQLIYWCEQAIHNRAFGEEWYLYKGESELALGRYEAAWLTLEDGVRRYPWSVRIRAMNVAAARLTGRSQDAARLIAEIQEAAARAPYRYSDADNLVVLGDLALELGADARTVLEKFYDRALQMRPNHRRALLSSGRLALLKQDDQLASETLEAALKKFPDDPDFQFHLAQSLRSSAASRAAILLSECLRRNPRHVHALLALADALFDGEQYEEAEEKLDEIEAVNPNVPEAWALRSAIYQMADDAAGAAVCRDLALSSWATNPAVDHLIGRKLSQKYRFQEGAAAQRRALVFHADYGPARRQLAEDLLRLGDEAAGWKLVNEAHQSDPYDVQLFNLTQLETELKTYETLHAGPFVVRMEPREARIYGVAVLDLLQRAHAVLGEKYGYQPQGDILVEIFPNPDDFAVRTFGLPGASGYLGVCFGRVITANSPAALTDNPANWQSVLWHEFCHVVTLELTRHRMPRWLSEGISVYEERLADPTWGARMNPRFRQLIISGQLTPIHELSQAFLRPDGAAGLDFAYFQSSLVVEFLIDRYGFEALKEVLNDLALGVSLNEALERRTTGLTQLDAEFVEYAREQARQYGVAVDWQDYDLSAIRDDDDPDRLQRWLDDHPNNLLGLSMRAEQLAGMLEYDKAEVVLKKMIDLFPEYIAPGNAYDLLATIYRLQEKPKLEQQVLVEYARRADAVSPVYSRLMELTVKADEWSLAREAAQRQLAVNPLLPAPHRVLALASEHLGQTEEAIVALKALQELSPDDLADVYYRLARLLSSNDPAAAKRFVLQALEIAPRYRDAQRLLLDLVKESIPDATKPLNQTKTKFGS